MYRDAGGEHDSDTVRGSEWFDHKRQRSGDAIGFLQEFYNMGFRKAVEELIRQKPGAVYSRNKTRVGKGKIPQKAFCATAQGGEYAQVLCLPLKTSGIAPEAVTHFVHTGTLYEDAEYHNAVSIATDERGKPCGGMKKGTLSRSAF